MAYTLKRSAPQRMDSCREKGRHKARARTDASEGSSERDLRLTSKNCPGPNGLQGTFLSSDPQEPFRKLFRTTAPSVMRGLMCRATSPEDPTLKLMTKLEAERKAGVRWGYGRGFGGAPYSPRKEGTGAWTPRSPMEEGVEGSDS